MIYKSKFNIISCKENPSRIAVVQDPMSIPQWKGYNKEDRERFTQARSLKDERLFGQWQKKRSNLPLSRQVGLSTDAAIQSEPDLV